MKHHGLYILSDRIMSGRSSVQHPLGLVNYNSMYQGMIGKLKLLQGLKVFDVTG